MRFSVFGIPVEVQPGFVISAALLGLLWGALGHSFKAAIVVWMLVVFVSVLVHELGHALAMMRHRIRPEITLRWMGGFTAWGGAVPNLTRPQRILISFAGPFAGFLLAGAVFALEKLVPSVGYAHPALTLALDYLWAVNVWWGVFNLAPMIPLDGGHILEQALGPKRVRLTAVISLLCGGALAAWAFSRQMPYMGLMCAMFALQSYQHFQASAPLEPSRPRVEPRISEPPVPMELERELFRAGEALDDDRYDQAAEIAEKVLAQEPPRAGRIRALEVIAWARLLAGRIDEAERTTRAIERHGRSDAALSGAILFARKDNDGARAVFESARAIGDDRKEIVGPLIQILIAQGEVARAAAIALDILDTLSIDDARKMAEIAFEQGAHGWAARLYDAVFERSHDAADASAAARARELDGDSAARA
jgi:Zn-dependent protease